MTRRELAGWLPVIEYCAEEVRRQGRGPLEVGYMLDAWRIAIRTDPQGGSGGRRLRPPTITHELVIRLGQTIEPGLNGWTVDGEPLTGYRRMRVMVGDRVCPDPEDVPRLMDHLIEAQSRLTPEEFYYEFEMIHPFRDGNGRVGKCLLNYLNGTLGAPVWPPNFWNISNP